MAQSAAITSSGPAATSSAWAPLHHPAFRAVWIASFVANTGTWAQAVGAQWLMGDLGGTAFQVALVQTATTLPVFLLVVPFGAFGDIADRRRLLIASHWFMFGGAATLAAVTATGTVTPGLLLGLTAVIGVGAALSSPTFAAIQPELIPREQITQAALLNGANLNVARAVGPALGGVLVGIAGAETTFALNALSFLAIVVALVAWEREPEHRPLGTEHVRGAIKAGMRYVLSAPQFRVVLVRTLLFITFASSLWALLPVVARGPLGLDAGGYGLLLASIGLGAIVGAFLVPAARARVPSNALVAAGSITYAAALVVIGMSGDVVVVVAALAVAGLAWIAVMPSLSACSQVLLPNWTRARGLAFFTLTFMGGQAIGSVVWGAVASALSLRSAFLISAVGLVIGPVVGARWLALRAVGDVAATRHWPEPVVELELDPLAGPVLVTVEWRVAPGHESAFKLAMRPVGRARKRTGATLWGLFQDTADPPVFVETFTVSTWHEHMRQHIERGTVMDREADAEARTHLADPEGPHVRHLVWAFRPTV